MSLLALEHKTLLLAVDFRDSHCLNVAILVQLEIASDLIFLIATVQKFKFTEDFDENRFFTIVVEELNSGTIEKLLSDDEKVGAVSLKSVVGEVGVENLEFDC